MTGRWPKWISNFFKCILTTEQPVWLIEISGLYKPYLKVSVRRIFPDWLFSCPIVLVIRSKTNFSLKKKSLDYTIYCEQNTSRTLKTLLSCVYWTSFILSELDYFIRFVVSFNWTIFSFLIKTDWSTCKYKYVQFEGVKKFLFQVSCFDNYYFTA